MSAALVLSVLLVTPFTPVNAVIGNDADGDGFDDTVDCDDNDASVFPGAPEMCNAIDDDCDGIVDNNTPGCSFFWIDLDGDGWGAGQPVCLCLPFPPFTAMQGGDCDDSNAGASPFALEICGNGIDDDCSGGIDDGADEDGDGFSACQDCDDFDPTVFPGAPELCDGEDNDCNLLTDDIHPQFCFGNGGDMAGCTPCPCGNEGLPQWRGGCRNATNRSAILSGCGEAQVSADTLRFQMKYGNIMTFGVLASADNALPNTGPCPAGSGLVTTVLDGLRCVGGSLLRHGARPTDNIGNIGFTTNGWGDPDGPPGGIIAQGGFASGQVRRFQVVYREQDTLVCMTGQNTTNGVEITFVP